MNLNTVIKTLKIISTVATAAIAVTQVCDKIASGSNNEKTPGPGPKPKN